MLINCGSGSGEGSSNGGDGTSEGGGSPTILERQSLTAEEEAEFNEEMVTIPGGTFMMGSDEYDTDEAPRHEVEVESFMLDKYEVSTADFEAFVDATKYETTAEKRGNAEIPLGESWNSVPNVTWYKPRGDMPVDNLYDQPVVQVSWFDALEYCKWKKKRLPTEAEWEYAAGGEDHTMYCLGDDFDESQYAYNIKKTVPAVTTDYEPNSFGVYHMCGNVWEWVSTLYDDYSYPYKFDGRENLNVRDKRRSIRGGSSWNYEPRVLRVANRHSSGDPTRAAANIGFRCAY